MNKKVSWAINRNLVKLHHFGKNIFLWLTMTKNHYESTTKATQTSSKSHCPILRWIMTKSLPRNSLEKTSCQFVTVLHDDTKEWKTSERFFSVIFCNGSRRHLNHKILCKESRIHYSRWSITTLRLWNPLEWFSQFTTKTQDRDNKKKRHSHAI